MKTHVPVSLRALACAALVGALSAGCSETTPVQDVVSRTFTMETAHFQNVTFDSERENAVASRTYDMPEITEEIVDAGTVTAQIDLGTEGAEWSPLPLTWRFEESGVRHVVTVEFGYRKGEFVLHLRATYESMIPIAVKFDDFLLRVVAIRAAAAEG